MLTATAALITIQSLVNTPLAMTTPQSQDERMAWWREAKFGLFIHWGLYSVLEGEYGDRQTHAEWIRTTAQIPLKEYDQLLDRFNPVKFDADAWAKMAKDAGMKYVVITTKHHDGFALYDSKISDFDVMATPFKRDIMAELSQAVRANGLQMGWYHSIMDWHHPDYLPRRDWETNRPTKGADFDRFEKYLHGQVSELLTNYGDIGVMWFDGEWESTWNHNRGVKLYDLCVKHQPDVLVNNRVDVGRGGMAGMTELGYKGDFGTPEQEIPETGLPGVDWESCITMNRYWGWNKADTQWKSTPELIGMLVDIVSKGGNFLLNVGPKPDGTFPDKAIERLKGIGDWMDVHGEAIYGTTASPFKHLEKGKATQKGNVVYVFLTDQTGEIKLPGLANKVTKAELLGSSQAVTIDSKPGETTIQAKLNGRQTIPVVKLTLDGPPVVVEAPEFQSSGTMFYQTPFEVQLQPIEGYDLRYTLNGTAPTPNSPTYQSPIQLTETTTVQAAYFKGSQRATNVTEQVFEKAVLRRSTKIPTTKLGLQVKDYTGNWEKLPDFKNLTPVFSTMASTIGVEHVSQDEHVARTYEGYIMVPEDGLYTFRLTSDDGSKLWVANQLVVDNDGLHSPETKTGSVALEAGMHAFKLHWFNGTGGKELQLEWKPEKGDTFQKPIEGMFRSR